MQREPSPRRFGFRVLTLLALAQVAVDARGDAVHAHIAGDALDRTVSERTSDEGLARLAVLVPSIAKHLNEAAQASGRAEATAIIANARKILTPNGVERLERVRIGGIDQWVSIRGADRRIRCCSTSMVARGMSRSP